MKKTSKSTNYLSKTDEYNSKAMEIANEIKETLSDLECLKNNYHYASGDMIDYYTYQIKAQEIRYRYLISEIRKYYVS